jgi:hypothetical protein
MDYKVNKASFHYDVVGSRQYGKDIVLLNQAIDLTAKTSWSKSGYSIEKLFDDSLYNIFQQATYHLLLSLWRKGSLPISDQFQLDQYHKLANTKEKHLVAVDQTKLIDVKYFPIDINLLEDRISTICNEKLTAKNPYDGLTAFHFRVIRPQLHDNNPLHRDVWLEDYKDCINLYIPVTGSNKNSSLVIIPGSHHWPESRVERTTAGALINGVKYNVPAVTKIEGEPEYVRPDPKNNEVLIFSPYLIHGGAVNLNSDSTRISIEIRLWKK